MNVFYVDENPGIAAKSLIDKHVVKMTLETAQILSTALAAHGQDAPYKPTHKNHPVVQWAAKSRGNFIWLCWHGHWLAWEYQLRYGRVHASEDVIHQCWQKAFSIPDRPFSPPPQCMPEQYRGDDAVLAYRRYYVFGKLPLGGYTGRTAPKWCREVAHCEELEGPVV